MAAFNHKGWYYRTDAPVQVHHESADRVPMLHRRSRTRWCLQELPGVDSNAVATLRKCLDAVHYLVMLNCAEENGWPVIAAQAATTLLRFLEPLPAGGQETPLLPADKAFYLAGMAWRKACSPPPALQALRRCKGLFSGPNHVPLCMQTVHHACHKLQAVQSCNTHTDFPALCTHHEHGHVCTGALSLATRQSNTKIGFRRSEPETHTRNVHGK